MVAVCLKMQRGLAVESERVRVESNEEHISLVKYKIDSFFAFSLPCKLVFGLVQQFRTKFYRYNMG